jgi:hypothetical protein
VNDKGQPIDVAPVASSNFDQYAVNAIHYIEKLTYTPATLNGQVISTNVDFFLQFGKSLYGSSNDGISSYFRKQYNLTQQYVLAGETALARSNLAELLEDNTKNLTEQAWYAWLASVYYFKQEDWTEYAEQIEITWLLKDLLPNSYAYKATINLYNSAIYQHQYQKAVKALRSLSTIKNVEIDKKTKDKYLGHIRDELVRNKSIVKETYAAESGVLYFSLSRQRLKVQLNGESVTSAQIRCNNYFIIIENKVLMNEIVLPNESSNCKLLMQGPPNFSAVIHQYGDAKVFL